MSAGRYGMTLPTRFSTEQAQNFAELVFTLRATADSTDTEVGQFADANIHLAILKVGAALHDAQLPVRAGEDCNLGGRGERSEMKREPGKKAKRKLTGTINS